MKTGIYKIYNTVNQSCYIGSCADFKASGLSHRWRKHKTDATKRRHHSAHFQNAWNKYGEHVFVFEVLLYCDPEDCLIYEQIAIDCYKPEYNIAKKAGNCLGVKRSGASKKKMSKAKWGERAPRAKITDEEALQIIEMGVIDKKTNVEIAKRFGLSAHNVSALLHRKTFRYLQLSPRLEHAVQQFKTNPRHRSRITVETIKQVRNLLQQGLTHRKIATILDVSKSKVGDINLGKI